MLRALALCCACVLAAPAAAFAEWHISPMVGLTFAGKTTLVDPEVATGDVHTNIGIAGTYLSSGLVGVEAIATTTSKFFQSGDAPVPFVGSSRLTSLMGNIVVTAPQKWTEYNLRPFISGGFGLLRTSKQDSGEVAEVLSTTTNLFGYNIGGGAIGFFTRSTGVRFDFRYHSTVRGTDHGPIAFGDVHLRYFTASVGIVIRR
jgi:hypothetical protein